MPANPPKNKKYTPYKTKNTTYHLCNQHTRKHLLEIISLFSTHQIFAVNKKSINFVENEICASHTDVQIDAKIYNSISRVLLEMDHTSITIYKKLCETWNKPPLFYKLKNLYK